MKRQLETVKIVPRREEHVLQLRHKHDLHERMRRGNRFSANDGLKLRKHMIAVAKGLVVGDLCVHGMQRLSLRARERGVFGA